MFSTSLSAAVRDTRLHCVNLIMELILLVNPDNAPRSQVSASAHKKMLSSVLFPKYNTD